MSQSYEYCLTFASDNHKKSQQTSKGWALEPPSCDTSPSIPSPFSKGQGQGFRATLMRYLSQHPLPFPKGEGQGWGLQAIALSPFGC